MTGFATKTMVLSSPDNTKVNVSISIKSLNSRFFEATCKLPHIASHLETDLIKMLKKNLHRGHIYLTIHLKEPMLLTGTVKPDMSITKSYIDATNKIQKSFSLDGKLTVHDIINLPNIFTLEEHEVNKNLDKQIIEAIHALIEQLIKARQKEGASLKKDLKKRIAAMHKHILEIEKSAENLMSKKKQEVATIIQKIDSEEEEASDIRKGNLLLMLDKLDINEEIVRFSSHLESLSSQLENPKDEMGKKNRFYTARDGKRDQHNIC